MGGLRPVQAARLSPAALLRYGLALAGIGQAQGPAFLDMASAEQVLNQIGRIEANQAEVNAILKRFPDQSIEAGLNEDVVTYQAAFARLQDGYGRVIKRAAAVWSGGESEMVLLADFEMLDGLESASAALAKKAEDVVERAGARRDSERRPPPTPSQIAGRAQAMSAATWGVVIGIAGAVVVGGLIAASTA